MATIVDTPAPSTDATPAPADSISTFAAPIQTRNTYPPGNPPLGRAPTPLGRTPQSLTDVYAPGSILGTRHAGPVLSGSTPGVQGAVGSAALAMCLQIDGSMGNFSIPIQFPGGSFLKSIDAVCYATGLPATGFTIGLGTQTGLSDIAAVVIPALNAIEVTLAPSVQLPLWAAVAPVAPFQMWLSVAGNTASAGGGIVIVNYVRLTGPWSQYAH